MGQVIVDNLDGHLSVDEFIKDNLCHFHAAMIELGLGDPKDFNKNYLHTLVERGMLLCPILYEGKNVGALMANSNEDLWDRHKVILNISAYVIPEYRGKNVLLKALNYIKRRINDEVLKRYHFVFHFNVHHTKKPLGKVIDQVCEIDF